MALIGADPAPFHIGPNGDPDDDLKLTRWFIVGDGTVSSIADTRNEIQCVPTGTLKGTVTAGGNPAVRAGVAIIAPVALGLGATTGYPRFEERLPQHQHRRRGNFEVTLPPGNYTVAANLDGSPYEGGGTTPLEHAVAITAFARPPRTSPCPPPARCRSRWWTRTATPAGEVSVVGFDPSPDVTVTQSIAGLINNRTGMFADREDPYPFGMAKVAFVGVDGDSGVVPLEPGNYQVYVSRGASSPRLDAGGDHRRPRRRSPPRSSASSTRPASWPPTSTSTRSTVPTPRLPTCSASAHAR